MRDGCYYGVVCALDKNNFAVWDLPQDYCRTRYKDFQGNDLVELNLNWFNTITDKEVREATLRIFPKEIRNEFTKYINNKRKDCWMILNPEIGICFPYLENSAPLFLSMIPSSIYYDKTVDTEIEREEEEIKKIIVQKVPHNASTNELVFEPEEALEMHTGTVGMLKGNKNLSVLTTYADVDAIVSKTAGESTSNTLEKMANNVYYKAGVSGQIFGAGSNSSVSLSIINDISKLTPILQKYSVFVTNIINRVFGNQNLSFKYTILPVSLYNQKEYVDSAYKLAGSGYSYLLPAVSMGMSQQELVSIKDLENNILELHDKLIPLSSTYTQGNDDKGGAPLKNQENKADQTIENEKSAENTGGNL